MKNKKYFVFLAIFSLVISCFGFNIRTVSAYEGKNSNTIYNMLETDEEKNLYESIYESCMKISYSEKDFEETEGCVYPVSMSNERVIEIVHLFIYDHPEFFWLSGKSRLSYSTISSSVASKSVSLEITAEYQDGIARNKAASELENAENKYLNGAAAFSDDYSKVKYFHDTLANNITYKENGLDQSVISALVNNETVCAGYTKAFKLLCDDAGIDCISVQGYSHAWNKCFIDGKWYNVDVTNDDQSQLSYFYFLVSDKSLDETDELFGEVYLHTVNSKDFPTYADKYPKSYESYDLYVLGDADGNGYIDSKDATVILVDYARNIVEGSSNLDADICDVNYDGKIDSRDATKILVYYAKSMVEKVPSSLRDFVLSDE
ncbi:MAG: hypothetical protein MRZ46_05215 [Oscillospiraceae bacterium]|nr:hypothetical protein [Oscillospiraceae bacterium]